MPVVSLPSSCVVFQLTPSFIPSVQMQIAMPVITVPACTYYHYSHQEYALWLPLPGNLKNNFMSTMLINHCVNYTH